MIGDPLCIALLALVGLLCVATLYFAHGKLAAIRQADRWMTTAHRMQRAAALALHPTHELVTRINGLYDAAHRETPRPAK